MNLKNIKFHLEEAQEELDAIVNQISKNKDYEYGEFSVAMSHLYHHLNTAWNSRDASEKEVQECADQNFKKWRRFPRQDELIFDD